MLVLTFGFGFMSGSTHRKLATEQVNEAVAPYLPASCAAKFALLDDADKRRAVMLSKKGNAYEVRQQIPDNLTSLPGKRWGNSDIGDKCAELIMNPPVQKAAELKH
jgi:hypothetical protein